MVEQLHPLGSWSPGTPGLSPLVQHLAPLELQHVRLYPVHPILPMITKADTWEVANQNLPFPTTTP